MASKKTRVTAPIILPTRIVALENLVPSSHNYNKHSPEQIAILRESLRTFGQVKEIAVKPLDARRYEIVAGEGLTTAAIAEGWTKLKAAIIPKTWSQAQTDSYLVADNNIPKYASPDEAQMNALILNLHTESEALARLAAGEQKALDALLAQTNTQAETADVGELIDKAAEHYFIIGDCRDFNTWQNLLNAAGVAKVNGIFTSPPYAEQRKKQYGGVPTAKYVEWWCEVQANARAHLANDGSFFVNIKPHCENGERVLYVFDLVLAMQRLWGWKFRDEFIWKHFGFPGENLYRHRNQFEPIYHFSTEHKLKHFPLAVGVPSDSVPDYSGGIRMAPTNADNDKDAGKSPKLKRSLAQVGNVIECQVNNESTGHKGVFPVALPEFFIKAYSDTRDAWLDPFLGSGTTIVAAHKNGRKGLGIEMLEKYGAVICERLELLGLTPKRLSTPMNSIGTLNIEHNGNGKQKAR